MMSCFIPYSYGLLGPSGCGKTSLLRCILNQLKPASGSISVFSSHPGEPGSLIPGPGVGYMPQEIALVMEFTIFETVHFFGKLHGMKQEQLQERSHFLLKFLDLPDGNRLVRNLRSVLCVCVNKLVDNNNYFLFIPFLSRLKWRTTKTSISGCSSCSFTSSSCFG